MEESEYSLINKIVGVDEAIALQKEKLNLLREEVRSLKFKKIDSAGTYSSITYKAIDGGKMKVSFNPFEINVIDVADSNGNKKLSFVFPEIKTYGDTEEGGKAFDRVREKIDAIPIINNFVKLMGCKSISELSFILNNGNNLMELSEWACIFERVTADSDEPIIILKDGLLRTKVFKTTARGRNYISKMREILKQKKKYVRVIGVSKTSAILSLLSTALFLEKIIPHDSIGYVKVPLHLELMAYNWSGRGKIDGKNPLTYALGDLYIAKLSEDSNLLITIEVPKDLESGEHIYSDEEISEVISYLAKDSKYSYPIVGYPQTIMRAHETAVNLGFGASIIRDELRDKIVASIDDDAKGHIRDAWLLTDLVDKGNLGGGNYG